MAITLITCLYMFLIIYTTSVGILSIYIQVLAEPLTR